MAQNYTDEQGVNYNMSGSLGNRSSRGGAGGAGGGGGSIAIPNFGSYGQGNGQVSSRRHGIRGGAPGGGAPGNAQYGGGGGSLAAQSYAAFNQGKKGWLSDKPGSLTQEQYSEKYFGGGGGGGGGAQMPYKPSAPAATGFMNQLGNAGAGLLDPSSAYSQRMRSEISEGIGQNTAAQQRGSALRAAGSGMGYGGSPELLEVQGQIGQEGMRAQGQADASAILGGQQLGGQMLGSAMGGAIGLQGQALQGFMGQQQMGQNQAMQDQQLQHSSAMQKQQLDAQSKLQQQALQQENYWRELMSMGGGY